MSIITNTYGVATISRLLQIIGLFCKGALQKRPIFSKETYNFKEPTKRSHAILVLLHIRMSHIYMSIVTHNNITTHTATHTATHSATHSATHAESHIYEYCDT